MSKINILDFSVANLIAAGEVVDRPASVVKELIENSIDAGSSEIEIEIKRGGVSYIRVTDNGCGMSKDDAEMCLLRHATSKIKDAKDLDGILTLGFRGEALAATSAVSQMTIITKPAGASIGTQIECDCGRITEVSETGCKKGTTMIVRELFANVPARRKFLKRDQAEGMAVVAVAEKEALSHPEISFRLISDGNTKLQTSGDKKLYNAIYALLGREFAGGLIEIKGKSEAVDIFGYIGRPEFAKSNRNYQNFFINGRYIKSRTATAALEQAYSSFMESEKFPSCVLNIVIHPALVDVNVHPTKLEVKFSNEKTVFDAVYIAVRNALLNDTTRPVMQIEKKNIDANAILTYNRFTPVYDRIGESKVEQTDLFKQQAEEQPKNKSAGEVPRVPFDDLPFVFEDIVKQAAAGNTPSAEESTKTSGEDGKEVSAAEQNSQEKDFSSILPDIGADTIRLPDIPAITHDGHTDLHKDPSAFTEKTFINADMQAERKKTSEETDENKEETPFKYLGIAFETYILVEIGDKLMMIDKHAAHERLIFEKMKKNMNARDRYTQLLLLPETVMVGRAEMDAALCYAEDLEKAGFDFRKGEREDTIELVGIPGGLEKDQACALFAETVTRLASGEGDAEVSRAIAFEKALYTASCKAAMKGSRHDGEGDLLYLVRELLRLPDIRYCPHGRPVAFDIPKGSIEHKFKRS